MFPGSERLLNNLAMRVAAHYDQLNTFVGKECLGCLVVVCLWEIDSAMSPGRAGRLRWAAGWGCALQEGVHLKLCVWENEGEVEAFRRKPVAHDANFDRSRHGCLFGAFLVFTDR